MTDPTEADKAKAREYVATACAEEGPLWFEDETGDAALASVIAQVIADEREAMRESAAKVCELIGEGLWDAIRDLALALEKTETNRNG